jgi:hypothetical protein
MKLLLFLCVVVASAQTHVRPDQIKNPQQVRIYWGDGMGPTTHVVAGYQGGNGQISDGRFVMSPEAWAAATAYPASEKNDPDNPLLPVCIIEWIGMGPIVGATVPPWNEQRNTPLGACYTKLGVAALKQDPSWAAFLAAHGF